MNIACLVPPIHALVNEAGHGDMPPLGLLSIAGPLIDAHPAWLLCNVWCGLTGQNVLLPSSLSSLGGVYHYGWYSNKMRGVRHRGMKAW